MKKMKKLLALLLAVVMVMALASCGGEPEASNPPASDSPTPSASDSPSPTPSDDAPE